MALTGNEAAAYAMRQINPDVVAAYPITPQTELMQTFAQYVADGLVDTELVTVESEHSAMSACVGAAAAGARTMTATSSQGLALMWEVLYIASGLRLPIVMCVINRALSAPINIHGDHSDAMGARDSGWIQLFCENAQEVYDNVLQAVRIAEEVFLPVMVNYDGFIISHGVEVVETLPKEVVQAFVGERKTPYKLLDVEHPITVGALDLQDYYMEHKRAQSEAMRTAMPTILKIGEDFEKLTGRRYEAIETYRLDDAELAIVALGSTCGTAKDAIDELRDEGLKAGLLKIRVFRPFPWKYIQTALRGKKAVAVMDRAEGMSAVGGPVFHEVRSCLYDLGDRPPIVNYIYGLGGRDVSIEDIKKVFNELVPIAETGKVEDFYRYLGVRE
ncbi:pyruvate ferredoxin oxidoreductase [bacterium]|nr:pyruvate ferredoxin oxidoreductase [bacterium]